MRRNKLIWYTVTMAVSIVGMSVYLLETEFWGWGVVFLFYGAFYLWAFGHANIDYLLDLLVGKNEKSPLSQQGPTDDFILPQLSEE